MTSITRRAALGGIAAVSATGGTGAAASADPSLAALEALIVRHKAAQRASDAAWEAVPTIERPSVGVTIGRRLLGRDPESLDETYRPILAFHESGIDQACAKHMKAMLSVHGRTPARRDEIRKQYAEWAASKKADLANQQAAVKRVEDETGFTAAVERADHAFEELEMLRSEIVDLVPESIPAAARKAAWSLEALDDADMAEMRRLLRSFAGDVAPA